MVMCAKRLLPWASVCCETGFSHMKEAKKERQAHMETDTLDSRLRIQLVGLQPPKQGTGDTRLSAAEMKAAERTYREEVGRGGA